MIAATGHRGGAKRDHCVVVSSLVKKGPVWTAALGLPPVEGAEYVYVVGGKLEYLFTSETERPALPVPPGGDRVLPDVEAGPVFVAPPPVEAPVAFPAVPKGLVARAAEVGYSPVRPESGNARYRRRMERAQAALALGERLPRVVFPTQDAVDYSGHAKLLDQSALPVKAMSQFELMHMDTAAEVCIEAAYEAEQREVYAAYVRRWRAAKGARERCVVNARALGVSVTEFMMAAKTKLHNGFGQKYNQVIEAHSLTVERVYNLGAGKAGAWRSCAMANRITGGLPVIPSDYKGVFANAPSTTPMPESRDDALHNSEVLRRVVLQPRAGWNTFGCECLVRHCPHLPGVNAKGVICAMNAFACLEGEDLCALGVRQPVYSLDYDVSSEDWKHPELRVASFGHVGGRSTVEVVTRAGFASAKMKYFADALPVSGVYVGGVLKTSAHIGGHNFTRVQYLVGSQKDRFGEVKLLVESLVGVDPLVVMMLQALMDAPHGLLVLTKIEKVPTRERTCDVSQPLAVALREGRYKGIVDELAGFEDFYVCPSKHGSLNHRTARPKVAGLTAGGVGDGWEEWDNTVQLADPDPVKFPNSGTDCFYACLAVHLTERGFSSTPGDVRNDIVRAIESLDMSAVAKYDWGVGAAPGESYVDAFSKSLRANESGMAASIGDMLVASVLYAISILVVIPPRDDGAPHVDAIRFVASLGEVAPFGQEAPPGCPRPPPTMVTNIAGSYHDHVMGIMLLGDATMGLSLPPGGPDCHALPLPDQLAQAFAQFRMLGRDVMTEWVAAQDGVEVGCGVRNPASGAALRVAERRVAYGALYDPRIGGPVSEPIPIPVQVPVVPAAVVVPAPCPASKPVDLLVWPELMSAVYGADGPLSFPILCDPHGHPYEHDPTMTVRAFNALAIKLARTRPTRESVNNCVNAVCLSSNLPRHVVNKSVAYALCYNRTMAEERPIDPIDEKFGDWTAWAGDVGFGGAAVAAVDCVKAMSRKFADGYLQPAVERVRYAVSGDPLYRPLAGAGDVVVAPFAVRVRAGWEAFKGLLFLGLVATTASSVAALFVYHVFRWFIIPIIAPFLMVFCIGLSAAYVAAVAGAVYLVVTGDPTLLALVTHFANSVTSASLRSRTSNNSATTKNRLALLYLDRPGARRTSSGSVRVMQSTRSSSATSSRDPSRERSCRTTRSSTTRSRGSTRRSWGDTLADGETSGMRRSSGRLTGHDETTQICRTESNSQSSERCATQSRRRPGEYKHTSTLGLSRSLGRITCAGRKLCATLLGASTRAVTRLAPGFVERWHRGGIAPGLSSGPTAPDPAAGTTSGMGATGTVRCPTSSLTASMSPCPELIPVSRATSCAASTRGECTMASGRKLSIGKTLPSLVDTTTPLLATPTSICSSALQPCARSVSRETSSSSGTTLLRALTPIRPRGLSPERRVITGSYPKPVGLGILSMSTLSVRAGSGSVTRTLSPQSLAGYLSDCGGPCRRPRSVSIETTSTQSRAGSSATTPGIPSSKRSPNGPFQGPLSARSGSTARVMELGTRDTSGLKVCRFDMGSHLQSLKISSQGSAERGPGSLLTTTFSSPFSCAILATSLRDQLSDSCRSDCRALGRAAVKMSAQEIFDAKVRQVAGLTPAGVTFLSQAFYPPGEHAQVRIPTENSGPSVGLSFRPTTAIAAPAGVTTKWDLAIIALPGDSNLVHWAAGPSPLNLTQTTTPANSAYGRLSAAVFAPTTSVSPVSVFKRDNAGNGTNQQWGCTIPPVAPAAYRHVYRSMTLHNASSSLYNGGSLVAASLDCEYQKPHSLYGSTRASAGTANTFALAHQVAEVPLAESELVNVPGVYIGDARDGVFMPLRLTSTAYMRPTVASGLTMVTTNTGLLEDFTVRMADATTTSPASLPAFPQIIPSGGTAVSHPWWISGQVGEAAYIDDTCFGGLATGVCIVRGVPPEAIFQLTVHAGIEVMLQPDSPIRSMAMAPLIPDPRAVNAYYEILAGMPRAYPASYNAIGAILPILGNAVRAALPFIAKYGPRVISTAATAFPVVKQVVDMMHDTSEPIPKKQLAELKPHVPSDGRPRLRARSAARLPARVFVGPWSPAGGGGGGGGSKRKLLAAGKRGGGGGKKKRAGRK